MDRFVQAKLELDKKYELKETLGTGAFSEVKKAVNKKTGETYAIKIIDRMKCAGKENMIVSEINILKKVKHDHIIPLYELFEAEQKIYLVMELVTGGELFDSIVARGHYTEADAAQIVYKILLAVDYLHDMGIVHRDLKPENLLFSSTEKDAKIMISDFGLSKIFNDEEVMKTACGTPGYVAPEVLKRKGYGKEVDLWSLGVITYILLCGYPPFYHENNQELFQLIMKGEYEFDSPHWDDISDEAKDFISKMLVVDSKKRCTAKQALKHSFLTMYCQTDAVKTPEECKVDDYVVAAAPNPKAANLAHRVSSNLRTRGMSVSRRRSVDTSKRPGPTAPHHPPPPIPQNAIEEESEVKNTGNEPVIRVEEYEMNKPLAEKEKDPDSGVMVESNKGSTDPVSRATGNASEADEGEFLLRLGEINTLIQDGKPLEAFILLQQTDMPHKLRKLYEDLIFLNPEFSSSSVTPPSASIAANVSVSKPLISQPSKEDVVRQLASLVRNSETSMAIIEERHDSTAVLVRNDALASKEQVATRKNNGVLQQILGSFGAGTANVSTISSVTKSNEVSSACVSVEEVKFLSLNIFLNPPGVRSNKSDHKDDRLAYFCEYILPAYDVICLQECFAYGTRRREKILQQAQACGFKSWVCSPASTYSPNDIGKIDGGLVILSKHSVVRSSRVTFDKGVGADRFVSKGALYAQIAVPTMSGEKYLHVFNTNIQCSYEAAHYSVYSPLESTMMTREKQLKSLKHFIDSQVILNVTQHVSGEEQQTTHDPIIVAGDFNVNGRGSYRDGSKHGDEYMIMRKILEGESNRSVLDDAGNPKVEQKYEVRDLYYDQFAEHPVTFGNVFDYTNKIPSEVLLTQKSLNGICACLDYIFELKWRPSEEARISDSQYKKAISIKHDTIKVEKFMTRASGSAQMDAMEKGTGVSDAATIDSQPPSINAPPASIAESAQAKSNGAAYVPETREVLYSAPHSDASIKPEQKQMEDTIQQFKRALSMNTDKNLESSKDDTKTSMDSVVSGIAEELSNVEEKKSPGVKELIDSKIAAMINFFAFPNAHVPLVNQNKIKFTQISDHYGLSMVVQVAKE